MLKFEFETGVVHSMMMVSEEKNIYEYLIETPNKNIQKFYLRGDSLEVGQKVRMRYNEDEEEYKLLGVL